MESSIRTTGIGNYIEDRLPAGLVTLIRKAGNIAAARGEKLYLVGGAVRDLILTRGTLDIDLVVEGNAIALADIMNGDLGGHVTFHRRFKTATLKWDGKSIDFITARAEDYHEPGALPEVQPGSLADDLARRDFSINAMAASLDPERFGELIDPHGGLEDLHQAAIRVLHECSFTDDATRIWRAVRYEQRLGFSIEPLTTLLLERDLPMLLTISGDRIRHELALVLNEAEPERALKRAGELGVLEKIHPRLTFTEDMVKRFEAVRHRYSEQPPAGVYLGLLFCQLSEAEIEQIDSYLHFSRQEGEIVRQTAVLQDRIVDLAEPGIPPSRVYDILHGYHIPALMAASLCADAVVAEQLSLYLDVLRHVNPALSGNDLKAMGVPEGREIKKILRKLRAARLDGTVSSRADEEETVRELIRES